MSGAYLELGQLMKSQVLVGRLQGMDILSTQLSSELRLISCAGPTVGNAIALESWRCARCLLLEVLHSILCSMLWFDPLPAW